MVKSQGPGAGPCAKPASAAYLLRDLGQTTGPLWCLGCKNGDYNNNDLITVLLRIELKWTRKYFDWYLVCVCVCTHTHTHIYTYIYTYTHMGTSVKR